MKPQIHLSTLLSLMVLIVAACAPQQNPASKTAATPAASTGGTAQDKASLISMMRAEPGETVDQVFFSVQGQILKVNGADVQVFEYSSAEAMEAEAAQVAPDGGSIGTNMVAWVATPHFYKSGRVLVLYVGDDTEVLGVLESVLGEQFAGR